MKKWRQFNLEKLREYKKRWRENNPEYDKKYREKNLEKIKKKYQKWQKENPERIKEYNKNWIKTEAGKRYKEKQKKCIQRWHKENPEKIRENYRRWRKLRDHNKYKGRPWNKGKKGLQKHTEMTKQKIRLARLKQKLPTIDTSIEKKFKAYLDEKKINYIHPFNLGNKFQCDFYLPFLNLIVECDGTYWHSRDDMKKRDKAKDAYAKKCGFNMLRLTEEEINQGRFFL